MLRWAVLVAVLAAGPWVAAAEAAGSPARGKGEQRVAKVVRMKAFASCERVVEYGQRHLREVLGPEADGLGDGRVPPAPAVPALPPPAPKVPAAPRVRSPAGPQDFSETNVQEEGIDEPDVVKTDGRRIFAVARDALHAVDARGSRPRLLGSLKLEGGEQQLLLHGRRLLVIAESYARGAVEQPEEARAAFHVPPAMMPIPTTLMTEVDVSDPSAMRVVRSQQVDGRFVSARLTGSTARVVASSAPPALRDPSLRDKIDGWLPRSVFENRAGRKTTGPALSSCSEILRPRTFSGLGMVTVHTIDLSKGLPAIDADTIVADGDTVYASQRGLYVASQRWEDQDPLFGGLSRRIGGRLPVTTQIHKFDASDPARTRYLASGRVRGYLLSQFSLSEHDGFLRVASTEAPEWWPGAGGRESQSYVTVLAESDGRLARMGRVGGLGRGERIYAVRFMDEVGYVVTFREIDPLYTIDLSQAAHPTVVGELKIRGYSSYLHPIGEGLLLGIGQDATDLGDELGAQLSLFDVSDLSRPVRLHQRTLGLGSRSEVEYDHHAFLYWPPSKLAAMPVSIQSRGSRKRKPFVGAMGFRVDRVDGIEELGRVPHGTGRYRPHVSRVLVIGERLFTLTDRSLRVNRLATFTKEGSVDLRTSHSSR